MEILTELLILHAGSWPAKHAFVDEAAKLVLCPSLKLEPVVCTGLNALGGPKVSNPCFP